jgi:hypothetical protein
MNPRSATANLDKLGNTVFRPAASTPNQRAAVGGVDRSIRCARYGRGERSRTAESGGRGGWRDRDSHWLDRPRRDGNVDGFANHSAWIRVGDGHCEGSRGGKVAGRGKGSGIDVSSGPHLSVDPHHGLRDEPASVQPDLFVHARSQRVGIHRPNHGTGCVIVTLESPEIAGFALLVERTVTTFAAGMTAGAVLQAGLGHRASRWRCLPPFRSPTT